MNLLPDRLLIVTDRHQATLTLEQLAKEVARGGGRWIWFRDRDLPASDRRRLAYQLAEVSHRSGIVLSVGEDIELAGELCSGAVHVRSATSVAKARKHLGPTALVGVSAHRPDEVRQAASAGADYVTLSPIFPTSSKPGYGPPLGLKVLGQAAGFGIPIIALGGVTAGQIAPCRHAGAAGVAAMGAAMRSTAPAALVAQMLKELAEPTERNDAAHSKRHRVWTRGANKPLNGDGQSVKGMKPSRTPVEWHE